MYDSLRVAIEHGLDNLKNDISSHNFGHLIVLFHVVIELASHGGLHDHDELLALNKCMVLLYDMFVLQGLERLSLLIDLLDHVGRAQLIPNVSEFDGYFRLVLSVPSQHHLSKTSHTQRPSELVVV